MDVHNNDDLFAYFTDQIDSLAKAFSDTDSRLDSLSAKLDVVSHTNDKLRKALLLIANDESQIAKEDYLDIPAFLRRDSLDEVKVNEASPYRVGDDHDPDKPLTDGEEMRQGKRNTLRDITAAGEDLMGFDEAPDGGPPDVKYPDGDEVAARLTKGTGEIRDRVAANTLAKAFGHEDGVALHSREHPGSLSEDALEEMEVELPDDPWMHRSENMRCATCMFYVEKETQGPGLHRRVGRCRRSAPTMKGFPVAFSTDWCGDHRIDEEKI